MSGNENLFMDVVDFYDLDPRDVVREDIPFYVDYAWKTPHRSVLELACGTGRITLPLAQSGCTVTGLDLSDAMLAVLRKKLENNPAIAANVHVVKGDMSAFHLGKTFDLIVIPFRSFQLLATETLAVSCLRCVREHLSDGGVFILDAFEPYAALDRSWIYPPRVQWEVETADRRLVRKLDEGVDIDAERQLLWVRQTYQEEKDGLILREEVDHLSLRYYYPEQMTALLVSCGLKIDAQYGWYDKTPIRGGREMIFVCAKS